MRLSQALVAILIFSASLARAQPAPDDSPPPAAPEPAPAPTPPTPPPEPVPPPPVVVPVAPPEPSSFSLRDIHIHGFVSQGAFVSTDNNYIGHSSRGSLQLFEAGLNVSTELTDNLRAGIQLFAHQEGTLGNYTPRVDWAFLDYHYRSWLGFRAGHTKIPFGLYNEVVDIDSARTQILLPQSIYPFTNRDLLIAQSGFSAYGTVPLSSLGELDYEVYAGTLDVPFPEAQSNAAPQVYAVDSSYVVGGQAFYHPPIEGLRVGASVLRARLQFDYDLDPTTLTIYTLLGLVPPGTTSQIALAFHPVTLSVASAEYTHGDWKFAAEYSRWYSHNVVLPAGPTPLGDTKSERFYGLATYQLSDAIGAGLYYSVFYPKVSDRAGDAQAASTPAKPRFLAWQRDAALSLRWDVNDHWLWKVEGHFIDGVASLFDPDNGLNATPTRYWGMFLVNTTVTF